LFIGERARQRKITQLVGGIRDLQYAHVLYRDRP